LLAAAALAVAWVIFRLERRSSRARDVASARATLVAVQRGIVTGIPELGPTYRGWGDIYFTKIYDGQTALRAGLEARRLVEQGGSYQVFVVPTEPLELLATPSIGLDLISAETVFAANFALWRTRVFNQFVEKQTAFNAFHAAEIADDTTSPARRLAIALAAEEINIGLHLDGIGEAGKEGGWYHRLTQAVAANVERLDRLRDEPWWRYPDERHLLVGDVLVAALAIATVVGTTLAASG
jgi:hypothetical protein